MMLSFRRHRFHIGCAQLAWASAAVGKGRRMPSPGNWRLIKLIWVCCGFGGALSAQRPHFALLSDGICNLYSQNFLAPTAQLPKTYNILQGARQKHAFWANFDRFLVFSSKNREFRSSFQKFCIIFDVFCMDNFAIFMRFLRLALWCMKIVFAAPWKKSCRRPWSNMHEHIHAAPFNF